MPRAIQPTWLGVSAVAPRRILIVEDDATLSGVIQRNLRAHGCDARTVGLARDALKEIAREQPDVLLLDIGLPDGTGWDLLRWLRARSIDIPVVVISATHVVPERIAEFRPLTYLPKPFPMDALIRLVSGRVGTERAS